MTRLVQHLPLQLLLHLLPLGLQPWLQCCEVTEHSTGAVFLQ